MGKERTEVGRLGVLGLLGVVFVTLKLTGYIDWSWWWVTSPFWAGFALAIAVLISVATLAFVVWFFERKRK